VSRPSLRKIARECGLSYQTVSRIMNGEGDKHRAETVALVERTAREHGYRRNLLARGMLTGRSMTAGVVLPFYVGRETNARIAESVEMELSDHDYAALMVSVHGDERDLEAAHRLIERRVDGIIYRPHPTGETDAFVAELRRHGIPLVAVVDHDESLSEAPDFVGPNEREVGRMAARRLLAKGHRVFGFTRIGENRFDVFLRERLRAFEHELRESRESVELHTTPSSADAEPDFEAIRAMLRRDPRPTAVFASVDDIACAIYRVAGEEGLRIPDDLAVLGSANYRFAAMLTPTLSSIDQNYEDVGRLAADLLLRRVQNLAEGKDQLPANQAHVGVQLIERESTARRR